MQKSYSLVIFDWEGTIGEDTVGQVMNALMQEAHLLGLESFNKQNAREHIELGLAKAIKKIFPNLSLHQYEHLLEAVQHSLNTCALEICLVPGSKELIQTIYASGMTLAVATNKSQPSLQRALRHSGLEPYFAVTRCAGQVAAKPSPQMLLEILAETDFNAAQTVMIGDSIADIEMAVALNVDAIGMDFYHVQRAQLSAAGALHVFDSYSQIRNFLQLA